MPSTLEVALDVVDFFDLEAAAFTDFFFAMAGLRAGAFFFAAGPDFASGTDFFFAMVICPCGPFAQGVGLAIEKRQLWSSLSNSQEFNLCRAEIHQGLQLDACATAEP